MLNAILFLVPAIAVFAPLLVRRYPGEQAVLRLRARNSHRLPRSAGEPVRAGRTAPRTVVRGSLLMGRSLAVRPPPAFSLAG